MQFNCTKDLCRTLHKKNADTKRTLRSHHYIEIEKLRKYLSGILYIENIKESDFNNTHIIKSNILPVSNIPEEEQFISSMTPIGFRNDQDESRYYVNSTFQVLFPIYIFRTLIMNIDCDKMFTNFDNSTDDYDGQIQKIIILQVVQNIFC